MKKPTPLSSIEVSGPIPAHLARSVIEQTLRGAILDGRLPCGMALRQQELATLFGVSRMPVREALRQLEAQGLLQGVPNKGSVVAALIDDHSIESYELRVLLEAEALRLSVPRLDAEDFAQLERYIEQLENEPDYSRIGGLNRQFHMQLYGKAANQKLLGLIEQGLVEEERFLRFNLAAMGLGKLSQDDHRRLLDSARARQVEACVEHLRHHLQRGIGAILHYLGKPAPR